MKTTLTTVLLLLFAAALPAAPSQFETWTSSAGTELSGRYLDKIDGNYWIVDAQGKLYQLSASQLSPESRKLAEEHAAKIAARPPNNRPAIHGPLNETDNTRSLKTAGLLTATPTTRVSYKDEPVSLMMEQIADQIAAQFPDEPRVTYRYASPQFEEIKLQITLRSLHTDRVLDFALESVGLYYLIDDGVIVINSVYPVRPK